MNKKIAFAFSILLSANVLADVGIGVSVQSDDSRVYVPIEISDSLRLEPTIRYLKNDQDNGDWEYSSESVEVGCGLFFTNSIGENINFLYGARAAYVVRKYESGASYEEDLDGYMLAPTLGLEYFITERISIGADVAISYTDIDGKLNDNGNKEDASVTFTETDTSLGIRFYF